MSRSAALRNFYGVDSTDGAGEAVAAATVATSNPRHPLRIPDVMETTIQMDSDSESSRGSCADCSRAARKSSDDVSDGYLTLHQLQIGVEQAKREVQRIQLLIFRAVWKHLVAHRRGTIAARRGPTSSTSPPAARSQFWSCGQHTSTNAAATRGRASRDPSLLVFPPPTPFPASTAGLSTLSGGSHRTVVYHERPFLPPSRHPAMPPLDAAEYAQFSQRLFSALMEASRRGLLATPRESTRPRGRALARFLEPVQQQQRQPATHTNGATADITFAPSLSVLILRVALERALAALFLRQLRLDAHVSRVRRAEVDLRYRYFAQRRALYGWQAAARAHKTRRQSMLTACVAAWVETVADRQRARAQVVRLREGLVARRRAWAEVTAARQRCWLRRWRAQLTALREARALDMAADDYYCNRQRSRGAGGAGGGSGESAALSAGPRLIADAAALLASTAVEVTPRLLATRVRGALFGHWRVRADHRRARRLADALYERRLLLECVHRARARVADVAALLMERRAALRAAVVADAHGQPAGRELNGEFLVDGACGGGHSSPLPSLYSRNRRGRSGAVAATVVVVHVEAVPEVTWRYKAAAADRVARSRALAEAFDHWRRRAEVRRADRLHAHHTHVTVMRRWLAQLSRQRAAHTVLSLAWTRWQVRLAHRQGAAVARSFHEQRRAAYCFCIRWQRRLHERRARRRAVFTCCVRRWWERAALRVAARVLSSRERQSLFDRWRQRASLRRQGRDSALVADAVRETVVLLSSLRWWRLRTERTRRARLSEEVLSGLRLEQQLATCFRTWKRRALRPLDPQAMPPPPPPPLPKSSVINISELV